MFLNFPLHPNLQKFCGIDLSQLYRDPNEGQYVIGHWLCNAMGLKPLPYASIQGGLRAKRIVMGDRKDRSNPYHWEHIAENLPFAADYVASLPRLRKVRFDGLSGSEVVQYCDDLRVIGATLELVWKASSRMAKGLCWLGLQDAARKRRQSTQRPGAWSGAVVSSDNGKVTKAVTQERWEKVQSKIRWIAKEIGVKDKFTPTEFKDINEEFSSKVKGKIHFKTTERLVGFIQRTS